jgi:hypothetical protein
MNLSTHFTLEEMTASQTAARNGIDNTPPADVIENLKRTAAGLEQVRIVLNANAIKISSGYRCPDLNAAVGSKPTSQHITGQAADFTCAAFGRPQAIMRAILASRLDFDQLIHEFDAWVHISFVAPGAGRKQALVIDHLGTRPFTP